MIVTFAFNFVWIRYHLLASMLRPTNRKLCVNLPSCMSGSCAMLAVEHFKNVRESPCCQMMHFI